MLNILPNRPFKDKHKFVNFDKFVQEIIISVSQFAVPDILYQIVNIRVLQPLRNTLRQNWLPTNVSSERGKIGKRIKYNRFGY